MKGAARTRVHSSQMQRPATRRSIVIRYAKPAHGDVDAATDARHRAGRDAVAEDVVAHRRALAEHVARSVHERRAVKVDERLHARRS